MNTIYNGHTQLYSPTLNQTMRIEIYGTKGIPLLCFPPQSSQSNTYKDYGLVDSIYDHIAQGHIQLFCVDSVDDQSWASHSWDNQVRIQRQEDYFNYTINEVLPLIQTLNPNKPYAFGLSMGATHAAITFFRRPDLFQGILALSPAMNPKLFFGDWQNQLVYDNAPLYFLNDLEDTSTLLDKHILFCSGQGDWEHESLYSLHTLQNILEAKAIPATFDYWGYDVNHDWYWWNKQFPYFINQILCKDHS